MNGAAVTSGAGAVASSSIDRTDPHRYIVNLTGVSNRQTVKVTLDGVGDAAGNQTALISAQMGVLLGDTNGNGGVNASDVSDTKAQSGQPLSGGNFRSDANVSGVINASDIALVKGQAGSILPAAGDRKE
ncbi:MAG: dockerin type I domain-containing protein [Chthoniobacterales bacterium]